MVFAHRAACVKPRFPKKRSKTKSQNMIFFFENGDFGNSEKYTETLAKSMVFRGARNFIKLNLAKNAENHGHSEVSIQPKRGGTLWMTRPAAAPASQGGSGWGTAPGNRSRYTPIGPIIAFPPLHISRNSRSSARG